MNFTNKLLKLSSEEEARLVKAIREFKGQVPVLESAMGALLVGQHYGWRVLKIVHNQTTYNKYEKILGVKFQDVCPERTDLSKKSVGLKIADAANSFWAVVRGKIEAPGKTLVTEDGEPL